MPQERSDTKFLLHTLGDMFSHACGLLTLQFYLKARHCLGPLRVKDLLEMAYFVFPFVFLDELTVYKVQNLQWTADFSGNVTLTWMRPKKMPSAACVYNVYYRWV